MKKDLIKTWATAIAETNDKYSFDPMIILVIMNIILQLIKLANYFDVGKSKRRLSWVNKGVIWFVCRKEARNREEARFIYNSICNIAYSLKEEEFNQLLKEGKKHG